MAAKKVNCGKGDAEIQDEVIKLQQEIKILEGLKEHPNIIKYYKNEIISNKLVLLMEFVPGRSVHGLIENKGVLTEKQASRYIKQTLQGLTYLHSNNIIHRDVKCANMLIGEGDIVKLCDFGISKHLTVLRTATCTNITMNLGTMKYMAPEMFEMEPDLTYGVTVDTWSTGCALVEMITKYPPWRGYHMQHLVMAIARDETPDYKLPPEVRGETRDFLDKCFWRDPKQRPKASQIRFHRFLWPCRDIIEG